MSPRTTPAADADIAELADELEAGRAGGGERFFAVVRRTLEQIERLPRLYPEVDDPVPGVEARNALLSPFHVRLVYVLLGDDPVVVAVLSTRRRDRRWHGRVADV